MVEIYLKIKSILEPIILGPGIFWIFFIVYIIYHKSKYTNRRNLARKIPIVSLFLIVILISPPFIEIISFPLYYITPHNFSDNADAIVVLGGGISDSGSPTPLSTERTYSGARLFLEGRASLLILATGYTNSSIDKSEAQAMQIIAIGMGVPVDKIILEEKSYNTYTNALETKKLLEKYNIKSIILVTSFSHLYRSVKVLKKMGIEVYPHPAVVPKLLNWRIGWWRPIKFVELSHEYIAIAIYKYKGWL